MADYISTSLTNYYTVNNQTMEFYEYLTYDNGTIIYPEVVVTPLSYDAYVMLLTVGRPPHIHYKSRLDGAFLRCDGD